ncbi:MAG: polysaccharide biosynthesis/export family protein [Longimicrobiales bacterium]
MLPRRRMLVLVGAVLCMFSAAAAQEQTDGNGTSVSTYLVRNGDVLRIRLWSGQSERVLADDFPVEQSGRVYLPRIGGVPVSGQTVEQLRAMLREAYKEEFSNPVITILPIYGVSVLGAVVQPGTVEVSPGMTLFDAIARASGFRENADLNKITLLRAAETLTVEGKGPHGSRALNDIQLQSGDRIVVGTKDRWTLQVVLGVLQAASFLATIYIALDR